VAVVLRFHCHIEWFSAFNLSRIYFACGIEKLVDEHHIVLEGLFGIASK
jgi:hypothetical protein